LLVRDVDRVPVIVLRGGREETVFVEPAVFFEEPAVVAVDPLQQFGIVIEDRDNSVVVVQVIDGSPAFRAGIRQGDVLLTVGGRPYRTKSQIVTALRDLRPGQAKLQVRRNGQPRDVSVNVPEMKQSQPNAANQQNQNATNSQDQIDGRNRDANRSDRDNSGNPNDRGATQNANDRNNSNNQGQNNGQGSKNTNQNEANQAPNENANQSGSQRK
jgi:hypothetical protein